MTNLCPYCRAEIKIEVTNHAVERLDERAYIKYFRGFKPGEDKKKWLYRHSVEAIESGTLFKSTDDDVLMYHHKGLMCVFRKRNKSMILMTVYNRNLPKKNKVINLTVECNDLKTLEAVS